MISPVQQKRVMRIILTNETEYSLRTIRALANGEKKAVKEISENEQIPHKFAYKILKKLEKAGITQSIQGPDGGYRLVKPLDAFCLYDVVAAVEGDLLVYQCLRSDRQCLREPDRAMCSVHMEYVRIQRLLEKEMKSRTMAEVMGYGCPTL